jgi:hypothetical protein
MVRKNVLALIALLTTVVFGLGQAFAQKCIFHWHYYYELQGLVKDNIKLALFYYPRPPSDGYMYKWVRVNDITYRHCHWKWDFLLHSHRYSSYGYGEYAFELQYFPYPGYYVLALVGKNLHNEHTYKIYNDLKYAGKCTISPRHPVCRVADIYVIDKHDIRVLPPKPLDLPVILENQGRIF